MTWDRFAQTSRNCPALDLKGCYTPRSMDRHRDHRLAPATVSPNPSVRRELTHLWRFKYAGSWVRGALGAPRCRDWQV
jgi:hypothetical protein